MLLLLTTLLAHGAEEWRLVDAQPKHDRHPVLLVVTPGYDPAAYEPLTEFLVKKGRDVRVLSFHCLPYGSDQIVRGLEEAASTLPDGFTLVAHGVGAVLPLLGDAKIDAGQYVFLGPTLASHKSKAASAALEGQAGAEVDLSVSIDQWTSGRSVDLTVPRPFGETDVAAMLLGSDALLQDCTSGPLAVEVQSWYREGRPPVDYSTIDTPVWIGVGLLDRLAPVEALVPASRELPNRELVRLGITRLDGKDLDHSGLLSDKIAAKAAAKAIKRGAGL